MSTTIFEPGKEYVIRDGRRGRVYATNGGGKLPIHGAIWAVDRNEWLTCRWTVLGGYYPEGESDLDLMPPEPEAELPRGQGYIRIFRSTDPAAKGSCMPIEIGPDGALYFARKPRP